MIPLDLISSLPLADLVTFLWFFILFDVPRHLLIALLTPFLPRFDDLTGEGTVTGIIPCHNEERTVGACVESMRRNGVDQIIVVNDGSTDGTLEVATALGVEIVVLPQRRGKADAVNAGLALARDGYVLVADADTVFADGAVPRALAYFDHGVAGVGFRLSPSNAEESLTTRFQAIEYAVGFGASRRLADLFGIVSNVSGAAGLFLRRALVEVGGWDYEVAEDAALAMKLRAAGWRLRYAADAMASTRVPARMDDLLLQRLRWDASLVTIWWHKYGWMLNPFARRFALANAFTVLDVITFAFVLPLALPLYFFWAFFAAGPEVLDVLIAAFMAMAIADAFLAIIVGVPLRLWPYWPGYIVVQTLLMRPLRVIALLGELVLGLTRYDPYIPPDQRWRLT